MNIVKWFKNLNFQGKLVVGYLFLALIPMLCVTWYTYFNLRSILLEQSYDNINEEIEKMNQDRMEAEFGDLLFSIVNAARLYHVNPDNALERTNRKFIKRFNYLEKEAKQNGRKLKDMTLSEMEEIWQEAKKEDVE